MLKRRFRILLLAPEYNLDVQARIPAALAALHNFILTHEPKDEPEGLADLYDGLEGHGGPEDPDHRASSLEAETHAADHELDERRDKIASDMWADYVVLRREMGIPVDGDEQDENEDEDDEEDEEEGGGDPSYEPVV